MRARSVATLASLVLVMAAAAPAGASRSAGASASCKRPPVTMRLESAQDPAAGGEAFKVTDAVARRVAIVPNPGGGTTSDPDELAKGRKRAAKTPLALYTLYLADFKVPRRELRGFGFGLVTPKAGSTVATITIVPPRKRGFKKGDVVRDEDLRYDTTTTFAPIGLTVRSSEATRSTIYDEIVGGVTIKALKRKSICLDIDITLLRNGETVSAAEGVVKAKVVRASSSFYFT